MGSTTEDTVMLRAFATYEMVINQKVQMCYEVPPSFSLQGEKMFDHGDYTIQSFHNNVRQAKGKKKSNLELAAMMNAPQSTALRALH